MDSHKYCNEKIDTLQADNAAKDKRIKELRIKLAESYMHNVNIEALSIANELPIPAEDIAKEDK